MSDGWGEFSWGPDKRPRPAGGSIVTVLLAVVIVALLAAGAVGLVVHHKSSPSSLPTGFQRLVDSTDQISLAVPSGWRAEDATSGTLSAQMQALAASNPQVSGIADIIETLKSVQVGLFAIDVTAGTALYSYGLADPGAQSLSGVPTASVVKGIRAGGGKDIQTRSVHLTLGDGEQISAELSVGPNTDSELLDYIVYRGRAVFYVLVAPGTVPPTTLFHQIEGTLAAA